MTKDEACTKYREELRKVVPGPMASWLIGSIEKYAAACADEATKPVQVELEAARAKFDQLQSLAGSPWLTSLMEMQNLGHGWDGYGAKKPTEAVLKLLAAIQPVPTSDGGVQLDWGDDCAEIGPDGRLFNSDTETTQPAKTGRLPEVGGKVLLLDEQTGAWDPAVVTKVSGDWFEAQFAEHLGGADRYNVAATEGITWRHAEP